MTSAGERSHSSATKILSTISEQKWTHLRERHASVREGGGRRFVASEGASGGMSGGVGSRVGGGVAMVEELGE